MKIQLLLATYNSEKFLNELFDSLIGQTYSNWELLIKDDGSTDATLEIINNYLLKDIRFRYINTKSEGKGAAGNFMSLLKVADADYFFFCDHDDVWLPEKIEKTLSLLDKYSKENPSLPIIVHSDLFVVDQDLKMISESFWKSSGIKPKLLKGKNISQVFNHVTGCAMAFNKNVQTIAFPFTPDIPMHDWWLVIQTLRHGGLIKEINEPTILYRQHLSNEVGARTVKFSYFVKKIVDIKTTLKKQWIQIKFLRNIKGINFIQYYYYKIYYTFLRKI